MTSLVNFPKNNAKRVLWQPTEGVNGHLSSQALFLALGQPNTLIDEILFHGSRGNGKSEVLNMGFLQHVGKGYGADWRGIIIRRQFKALKDLIKKSLKLIPKLFPGAVFNKSNREWRFPEGETLTFEFIEKMDQYEAKFHGQEYSYIGFDELTTWATDEIYVALLSTLRSSFIPRPGQPAIPLQVRSTTNPWGVGKRWVKERFLEGKTSGEIEVTTQHVYDENDDLIELKWRRTAIFGTIFENKYVGIKYKAWLQSIADPMLREAWLFGNWDVVDDTAIFAKVWNADAVLLEPFVIPAGWRVERSFDWGSSTPYCCLWTAETDGTGVMINGQLFCPPKGSLVVVGEEYGTPLTADGKQVKRDEGLYLSAPHVGENLKKREQKLLSTTLSNHQKVSPGPADNQVFNGSKVDKGTAPTIYKDLAATGMTFVASDKSPGSRATSSQLMYSRLQATRENHAENPHIYIFKGCKFLARTIPDLYRDEDQPDAVAKAPDDHAWDALAYRLTWKRPVSSVKAGVF